MKLKYLSQTIYLIYKYLQANINNNNNNKNKYLHPMYCECI